MDFNIDATIDRLRNGPNSYEEIEINAKCQWCKQTKLIKVEKYKSGRLLRKNNMVFNEDQYVCSRKCDIMKRKDSDMQSFINKIKIPLRYSDCTLDNFVTGSNIISSLREVIKSEKYEDPILFTGNITGTGKTHLAIAMILEIGKTTTYTPRFISFSNLMAEIFNTMKESNDRTTDQLVDNYSMIDVLCIDDLGAEHTTAYSTSILYRILNNRYNSMRMTVATTNLKGDEICEMYDRRILSRLSCGHVFTLTGKDKRIGSIKNVTI